MVAAAGGMPVKVIIEVHYLDRDQLKKACEACIKGGAAFVKTATGWAPSGATLEVVQFITSFVGKAIKVKAAGGIRTLDTLLAMYRMGVARFGINLNSSMEIVRAVAALPGGAVEVLKMADRIIAYDLGTGGAKASLYDREGTCQASTFVSYETFYPDSGWHEQRPQDWWNAIVASTRELLARKIASPSDIEALAISGQSLAVIPLDAKGELLRQQIPIWSDSRAEAQAAAFFKKIDPDTWYMTTGNGFPASCYSVFKVMWYRDNEPEMFSRIHTIIGSKDWVNLRLTGKILTDFSYASGSGIYDLLGWKYQKDFIRASGLPEGLFPQIVPSTEIVGTLTAKAAEELGLPRSVKVACGGVDNSCMALGARNTKEGRVYTSLGSSSWIAVSSAKPVLDAKTKPFVFTHVIPGLFTSAVSIFAGGSSFRWIRERSLRGRQPVLRRDDRAGRHVSHRGEQAALQPEPWRGKLPGAQPAHPRRVRRSGPAPHPRGPHPGRTWKELP